MAMKLYEITEEYRTLQEAIDNGEIPDEAIGDMLEAVSVPFDEKIDSLATWVKEIDAENLAIETEIKRLSDRKRAKSNLKDRIKESMCNAMAEVGRNKVETARNKVTTRTSSRVNVISLDALLASEDADNYVSYSDPVPNKNAIAKDLKEGKHVSGCELVQTQSVVIK